jgi:hypothetical protein
MPFGGKPPNIGSNDFAPNSNLRPSSRGRRGKWDSGVLMLMLVVAGPRPAFPAFSERKKRLEIAPTIGRHRQHGA